MKALPQTRITPGDAPWPRHLTERLGTTAPPQLSALGNLALLALPKTALFCSARCPGDAILRAYDQAAKWRDEGRCVISGFQSPVEKECSRILLRGFTVENSTPPAAGSMRSRRHAQRGPGEFDALAAHVVDHLGDSSPATFLEQEVDSRQFLAEART